MPTTPLTLKELREMMDQGQTTFDRARRKRAYRRLARVVSGSRPKPELLPLDEATKRLRPFARNYVGLRPIPVRQIVGTEGRESDFDRDFLPLRSTIKQRWRQVERGFPEGDFPPIVVYQIGDVYFVIDGHHRVAIARQRGAELIDAEVTELHARWHLPADADLLELIHAEQERIFMDESGLAAAHPELRIRFSRPVGYIELLENVQLHGYHLMRANRRVLEPSEIAANWYDRVYAPTLEAIERERLAEARPETTEADRFLCVSQRRRELLPEWGRDALEEAYRRVRADGRGHLRRSVLRQFAA